MTSRLKTLLAGTLVFLVCGAPTITFDALFPAEINLPGHIKTVVIIDRSQTDKKALNIIEGGLTGEGIGQDRLGSQMCIDGLYRQVNNSKHLSAVRTNRQYVNSGSGVEFPLPLDWQEIEELCRQYNADAVISLEMFDSDFIADYARVKVGMRLYDPSSKTIFDEVNFSQNMAGGHPARNVPDAIIGVLGKNQAVKDAAFQAGIRYGQRISPTWFRVHRIYYKRGKGNDDLKEGARMMEVNDWDVAIEDLNKAMNDRHRKVKGRTAHNLAVVYEILGEYELANEWARAAWGKYRNKDSKDYSYLLGQRQSEIERLKQQMEQE